MEPLLFLSHRLPYPPNKGDKIRSYHFLRHLASKYRVFLGTFVDDPADWAHVAAVSAICAEVHVEPLTRWGRLAAGVAGLARGEALTLAAFRSRALARWVRETASREGIRRAIAFSSPMVQCVLDVPGIRCMADFVDVDSAKWDDYARRRRWPVSAIYAREAKHLVDYEVRVAGAVDAVTFVTDDEVRLFRERAPASRARLAAIPNGVDSEYFSPSAAFASPFADDEQAIVFTGAMDYWPNIDAVAWFAHEVFPDIRRRIPQARFHVVGMNPGAAVRSLTSDPAVVVTGRVPDVRPYLQHARVVVAPLRVARGIQNKVLEAMAMAKAVVVTKAVASGLVARPGVELEVASGADEFARRVVALVDSARAAKIGDAARRRVVTGYAWAAALQKLDALVRRIR